MKLSKWFGRRTKSATLFAVAMGLASSLAAPAFAQYTVTNLVSNQHPIGTNAADPQLINAWGITSSPTSPFWVSDNGSGKSTLYNAAGQKQGLVVTVPALSDSTAPGTPTGVLANPTTDFSITITIAGNKVTASPFFLFVTQDGTVRGWNPTLDKTHALLGADRSSVGASYTSLAIANDGTENLLYAADNSSNRQIDVFRGDYSLKMSFSDPEIQQKMAPYGMRVINGKLWVTFTPLNKGQDGLVDIFNLDGTVFKHDALHGPLHSPWGLALAPSGFGPFSNAILVGNNDRQGRINAFDPTTGKFLGALTDASGAPISIDQLWGLEFGKGAGANGATTELFFTAGPDNYANGLFGVVTFTP